MKALIVVLALFLPVSFVSSAQASNSKFIYRRLPIVGALQMDSVGLGGETTGVLIHTYVGTYELALSSEMIDGLRKFDGKLISVTGFFKNIPGVEVPVRNIIDVDQVGLFAKKLELKGQLSLQQEEDFGALRTGNIDAFFVLIPPQLKNEVKRLEGKKVTAKCVKVPVPSTQHNARMGYFLEDIKVED